ncbi:hypothetical protein EAH79_05495 [Sphingomonas koreensis]|nr:hypothetical protein EAH79_05495 [Sphingomonas koreensis]
MLGFVLAAAPAAARRDTPPAPAPLIASVDGLPIGEIPKQQLPARGCAAYLWSAGASHVLIAMASADPAQLRVALDGKLSDYARASASGAGGFGLDQTTTYQGGDVTAVLDINVQSRAQLTGGAIVPSGTLTIERPGKDTVIVPVGGLIGCSATAQEGLSQ